MKIKKPTKTELLQKIVNEYIADGQPWPAPRRAIAEWAIRTKRWSPPRKSLVSQCAEELADAMRLEMTVDPQGRTIHAKRCAKILEVDDEGKLVQKTFWFDTQARTAKLMRISQAQWRNSILGECKQLRIEEESFNDNNTEGAVIRTLLDFETDILDAKHGTDYNPSPPVDSDDDEDDGGVLALV